ETMREGFEVDLEKSKMGLLSAWSPYLIVVLLLLLTRIVPFIKNFTLTYVDLSCENIFGIDGITSNWEILYSPGTIFILAALIAVTFQSRRFSDFSKAAKESLFSIKDAAIALFATLALVQVFANSGLNANDLLSMPQYIANSLANS